MGWEIEATTEFRDWYWNLEARDAEAVSRVVEMLEMDGPALPFPYSSNVNGSRYGNIRELRVQSRGHPYRMLYAFDPRRHAILLLGGDKRGDSRWYERNVPRADALYAAYLDDLRKEGLI